MAKLFISHSSEDKEIVDLFKNIILNAGLGIKDSDIAYTSAVETGVPTDNNIQQYIKDNIQSCEVVFFMVSENYKSSEVCLNEMGAAWALNKPIKPFLLNDVPFDTIGWLYKLNLCAKINDDERLDELKDDIESKCGCHTKTSVWNRNKKEFIYKLSNLKEVIPSVYDEIIEVETEELGLLDYRELFDGHIATFINITQELSIKMNAFNNVIMDKASQMPKNYHVSNIRDYRTFFTSIAQEMNEMSKNLKLTTPNMQKEFSLAIDNAIHMQQFNDDLDNEQENRESLDGLLSSILGCKNGFKEARTAVAALPNIEKNINNSKRRLISEYDNFLHMLDQCISKTTELLKA